MADAPPPLWKLSRRDWLRIGLGASAAGAVGLGVGFWAGGKVERRKMRVPPREQPFSPNVFLAIDTDGTTTLWLTRSEMGQGVYTALPRILADELEADWAKVRVEQAPGSPTFGAQTTVASASVRSLYPELRRAGAAAREMLVTAAAQTWEVDRAECRAAAGFVVHAPTGRQLAYGTLAARAGELDVPSDPPLKDPADFRYIGRPARRLDAAAKSDGSAVYGLDVRVAGMRFATLVRPPSFGARLASSDEAAARAVSGVLEVVEAEGGVVVIAQSTWAAFAGARALAPTWSGGSHEDLSNARVAERLAAAVTGGAEARREGDVEAALAAAATRLEAEYAFPYLAHACMEPINATARIGETRCEVWAPTQDPQRVQQLAADATGLPIQDCHVHVPFLGGGFGRRTVPVEVEQVLRIAQRTRPHAVQLVWTREEDVRNDFYRPAALHRFEVGLDEDGAILGWRNRIATTTQAEGVDRLAIEGAEETPYAAAAVDVTWAGVDLPLATGIWRSVGHSYNAFAVESMIDECAHAAGVDPLDYRLARLGDRPTHRALLERVRAMSGWGAAPEGRAQGVAVHECYGSYCAMVAEVGLDGSRPRVHRVWAAVECGQVVDPDGVAAQIEGSVVFGLSAALDGELRIEGGRIVTSNFHDYPILRMDEMPTVEVVCLASDRPPSGVGEIGVPPIAPAVTNALFALTAQRVRRLPIRLDLTAT